MASSKTSPKWWAVFLTIVTVEVLLLVKLLMSEATTDLLFAIGVVTGLLVLTLRIDDLDNFYIGKDGLKAELSRIAQQVEGKVNQVEDNIKDQVHQLGDDINTLLISTVLDAYEYITLKKIAGEELNDIYDFTYPKGRDLLERLRNRGLIDELGSNTIFKDENNGKRIKVREHFLITERGRKYLEALKQKGLDRALEEIVK